MPDPTFLYHAAPLATLESILRDGLKPGSYAGRLEIAEYYADVLEDEGEISVLLRFPLEAIDAEALQPDQNGLEEPLTYTLSRSEEDIWQSWSDSSQDWKASLDIIGSLRISSGVPPTLLSLEE